MIPITPDQNNLSVRASLVTVSTNVCLQLSDALKQLSDQQYAEDVNGKSAIGKHVRHILEFYQAFFDKITDDSSTELSYDQRKRNMILEQSREGAILRLQGVIDSLHNIPHTNRKVTLRSVVDPDLPMFTLDSTLYRELFYLVDHCIHHMALIKTLAAEQGFNFGHHFGLAQSTKAYEENRT